MALLSIALCKYRMYQAAHLIGSYCPRASRGIPSLTSCWTRRSLRFSARATFEMSTVGISVLPGATSQQTEDSLPRLRRFRLFIAGRYGAVRLFIQDDVRTSYFFAD